MTEPVVFNCGFLARELKLAPEMVQKIIDLLAKGMPVPYIVRFQKGVTNDLPEEKIREIAHRYSRLKTMYERKQSILRNLQNDQKLTPELERMILDARTERRLEDIYLAYKPRKQTSTDLFREKGLESFALSILQATEAIDLEKEAESFVDPEKDLPDTQAVLDGVAAILIEKFSWNVELRQRLREHIRRFGRFISQKVEQQPDSSNENISNESESDHSPSSLPVLEATSIQNGEKSNAENMDPSINPVPEDPSVPDVDPDPTQESIVSPEDPKTNDLSDQGDVVAVVPEPDAEPLKVETVAPIEKEKSGSDKNKNKKSGSKKDKKILRDLAEKEAMENQYREFYHFSADVRTCPASRLFGLLRAEKANVIEVRLDYPKDRLLEATFENVFSKDHPHLDYLKKILQDTFDKVLFSAMEKELRREFIERAEVQTLDIIVRNLRNLVLLRPLDRRRVLAIDPGFNHGCKLVALDEFGNILALDSVFTTGSGERKRKAAERITALIRKFNLTVIGIGNGTGSREAENFIANLLVDQFSGQDIGYAVVNEIGSSSYAASPLGKEELPTYNTLFREAVSVGRRIQDPLHELVKIDPALLGVGVEIQDLKTKDVRAILAELLESAVNFAGADLNRASASYLKYIAGLNPITAQRICDYRKKNGPFKTREELKKVAGISEDAWHYAIGFLRIPSGYEPLDTTWIHPVDYDRAKKILEKFGFTSDDIKSEDRRNEIAKRVAEADLPALASEFDMELLDIQHLLNEFVHPGLDRRSTLSGLIFKKGTLRLEDLKEGMELIGTVQNVVNFGAFIDIGLPQSGLVHISVMGDQFVRDAHQKVVLGDIVKVWVVKVDPVQKRISLTMIPPGHERIRYSGSKNRKQDQDPSANNTSASSQSKMEKNPSYRSGRNDSSEKNHRYSDSGREMRSKDRNSERFRRDRDHSSDSGDGQNIRSSHFSRERRERMDKKQAFSRDRSSVEIPSTKVKKVAPLSDEMKKGKEPMRSFSDLAQFFGISKQDEE